MKYFVSFQEMGSKHGRPIDQVSHADFQTDGLGILPNVGDYVQISPPDMDSPTYKGKVASRLFSYIGEDHCFINIVVQSDDNTDWGKLIKE